MSLYAQYAALLDGVLDELVAEGALPAGLDRTQRDGRAAARSRAWRPRDQRRDGAGQGRRHQPARACRSDQAEARGAAAGDLGRDRRARASSISGSTPDAWRDELRTILREGERVRPVDGRRERAGQRRICLGQPDRAAAHGPLPRRGGRRQPRAAARGGGLPRHQGILCQRRRRAGRYARPLGRTCATARRSAKTSARSPKACIRAII